MFQNFLIHLKKKKILLFKTLTYFVIDNRMKLFFPTLIFHIKKKNLNHCYNQHICIYICDSFLVLSISLSPLYVFLAFLSV